MKKDKNNCSKEKFDEVEVTTLSSFLEDNKCSDVYFDMVKIDVEGSEYDILFDILDNELYKNFGKIMFEDHCRKIRSIHGSKTKFIKKVKELGIVDKFYIQTPELHDVYVPLKKHGLWKDKNYGTYE